MLLVAECTLPGASNQKLHGGMQQLLQDTANEASKHTAL
jgi:hypothetical protein